MYLDIEEVIWIGRHFDIYTTLIVCGFNYTFTGEISVEDLDPTLSNIFDNLESWEEDGAELEMNMDLVQKVVHKEIHTTNIILH